MHLVVKANGIYCVTDFIEIDVRLINCKLGNILRNDVLYIQKHRTARAGLRHRPTRP